MARAAWHSSGLGEFSRWPLRAHRDPERSAVALGHILICTWVERDRVDSVRAHVLLVPLCGRRRPPYDHAATSSCGPVRTYSCGATDSVFRRRWFLVLGRVGVH